MIEFLKGFFIEGRPESSKRLTMIMSYVVTLSLCIIAVIYHFPIESNVMTMLLGCCGVSSSSYVISTKKEIKDDKQSQD